MAINEGERRLAQGMIRSVKDFIEEVKKQRDDWGGEVIPWFRGECVSDTEKCALLPEIGHYEHYHENHVLQSFRRQAGGLANVPPKEDVDYWLMLAQHYGLPTRLLDWTEGAMHGLYFSVNRAGRDDKPRVHMLNPRKLNNDLTAAGTFDLNYPLVNLKDLLQPLTAYFRLAWENRMLRIMNTVRATLLSLASQFAHLNQSLSSEMQRYAERFPTERETADNLTALETFKAFEVRRKLDVFLSKTYVLHEEVQDTNSLKTMARIVNKLPYYDMSVPIAFPATYQDQRMIAQRSCFTIHGDELKPLHKILQKKVREEREVRNYLVTYDIDIAAKDSIIDELSLSGISAATIFPDLDHLAQDLKAEICKDLKRSNPSVDCTKDCLKDAEQ